MSSRIDELTATELHSVSGGDWYPLPWWATMILQMGVSWIDTPALVMIGGSLGNEP